MREVWGLKLICHFGLRKIALDEKPALPTKWNTKTLIRERTMNRMIPYSRPNPRAHLISDGEVRTLEKRPEIQALSIMSDTRKSEIRAICKRLSNAVRKATGPTGIT